MCRDYETMRAVLAASAGSTRPLRYGDLYSAVSDEDALRTELARLGERRPHRERNQVPGREWLLPGRRGLDHGRGRLVLQAHRE